MAVAACLFVGSEASFGRGLCPVVVFAASSMTEAMSEVGLAFERASGACVTYSFAASSTLARQIAHGAPAHVFISANTSWMDFLQAKGAIDATSRHDLVKNALVLIGDRSKALPRSSDVRFALTRYLRDGYLVIGDPTHVPAGQYARQALQASKLWDNLKGRIVYSANVREALALVERGEAALGITYATDAMIVENVRTLAQFPAETHEPILYPVARVAGVDNPAAERYLAFLQSAEARHVYLRYGFLLPEP